MPMPWAFPVSSFLVPIVIVFQPFCPNPLRARILYNMCTEQKTPFLWKKMQNILVVCRKAVPLHPQTKQELPLRSEVESGKLHREHVLWKIYIDRDCSTRNKYKRTVNIQKDNWEAVRDKRHQIRQVLLFIALLMIFYNEEFDPGSGWTLATGLTHASRGAAWT